MRRIISLRWGCCTTTPPPPRFQLGVVLLQSPTTTSGRGGRSVVQGRVAGAHRQGRKGVTRGRSAGQRWQRRQTLRYCGSAAESHGTHLPPACPRTPPSLHARFRPAAGRGCPWGGHARLAAWPPPLSARAPSKGAPRLQQALRQAPHTLTPQAAHLVGGVIQARHMQLAYVEHCRGGRHLFFLGLQTHHGVGEGRWGGGAGRERMRGCQPALSSLSLPQPTDGISCPAAAGSSHPVEVGANQPAPAKPACQLCIEVARPCRFRLRCWIVGFGQVPQPRAAEGWGVQCARVMASARARGGHRRCCAGAPHAATHPCPCPSLLAHPSSIERKPVPVALV